MKNMTWKDRTVFIATVVMPICLIGALIAKDMLHAQTIGNMMLIVACIAFLVDCAIIALDV